MNIYCFSTLSFAKLQFKSVINKAFHKHGVASFTDAWIETFNCSLIAFVSPVASFTDAWIETGHYRIIPCYNLVASFTDAWIETVIRQRTIGNAHRGRIFYRCVDWNRLLRMPIGKKRLVASFTDAWIETNLLKTNLKSRKSRIFYRCVDWNVAGIIIAAHKSKSHLLQMRGLKLSTQVYSPCNYVSHLLQMRGLKLDSNNRNWWRICRIFYRCVDWN